MASVVRGLMDGAAYRQLLGSLKTRPINWTDVFPMDSLKLSEEDHKSGRAVFVEVDGTDRENLLALRRKGIAGKMIIERREAVAPSENSAETQEKDIAEIVCDLFSEQPVKGAQAYYVQDLMHHWSLEKCVEILRELKNAFAKDSMLLIDDMMLPDYSTTSGQAQKSVQSMSTAAAIEARQRQWRDLLQRVGLNIERVHPYNEQLRQSVIVAKIG